MKRIRNLLVLVATSPELQPNSGTSVDIFDPAMLDLRRLVNQGVAEGSLRFATARPILSDAAAYETARRRFAREVIRAGVTLFPDLEGEIRVPADESPASGRGRECRDSLAFYLREIRRFVPTTREEEESLARALEFARDVFLLEVRSLADLARRRRVLRAIGADRDPLGLAVAPISDGKEEGRVRDRDASASEMPLVRRRLDDACRVRSVLVAKNLHLVPAFAARYRHMGVPYLDLIQEGNAALFRAAEKFDWRKGVRFPTYARWWVQQAVLKCLYSQSRVVRVPVYLNQKLKKFHRANLASLCESGRPLTAEEISVHLEEPLSRVRRALRAGVPTLSLDGNGTEEERLPLRDLVVDPRAAQLRDTPPGPPLRARLEESLLALSDREQRILRLRYGLEDGRPRTLEQVAFLFGVSRERIRQLQVRALRKLKAEAARTRLGSFLS